MIPFQYNVNSKDEMVQIEQFTSALWEMIKDEASFHNIGSSFEKLHNTQTAFISNDNSQVNTNQSPTSSGMIVTSLNSKKYAKSAQLYDYYGEPIN